MARDTSFYYSFLILPPDQRRAIVAVWDFCRAVDDAADEAAGEQEAEAAVIRWREEVVRCFSGAEPRTPQGQALQPLIAMFHLPQAAFEALIEGVAMDLKPRRYETVDELYQYCVRVASAVGLMCIEIFGCTDPASKQYAIDLGLALQLTNILRDVREDLARGRVYIPTEDMRRFGVSEADLRHEVAATGDGVRSERVRALLAHQAVRARDFYRRADAAMPRVDARRLAAARIMGAIYRALLARIERRGYDVFSRVIRVSRPRRASIALATWSRIVMRG